MTAHPFLIVDKATFYRFVQAAPEGHRYEFVKGRIVHAMTGGTVEHSTISRRFATLIERQLDQERWLVSNGSDRGVETSMTVRYPDVIVEPSPPPKKSLSTRQAVVVVEVLSESSGERDLEIKPSEYLELTSLQAYIVASQDEPVCQMWLRGADGRFPAQPETIDGRDQVIHIPALSVAIPLEEVYRGIGS
jgi:Uma2 family endonuclease